MTWFIVSLTYKAPLADVDALLPDHVAFLDGGYANGVFVASGRKVPRTGGVILARAPSLDALQATLADDPFAKAGVATYDITAWDVGRAHPQLDFLVEPNDPDAQPESAA